MALQALQARVHAGQDKPCAGVIEGRTSPRGGVVALFARLGKVGLHVVGIGGALEILQVTRDAGSVRAGEAVVAIHVALLTLQRCVCAGQGESHAGMIEGSASPGCCVVTLLAGLGEVGLHVIGIGRALIVLQVARHAGRYGDAVVVVDVALRAGNRNVRSGEGKSRGRVVERRRLPRHRVVALLAGLRETLLSVIWVRGALVVLKVTRDASLGRQIVVVVDVALRTSDGGVRSVERKTD